MFRVRGRTRWGEAFAVRFDAPDQRAVEAWLAAENATVERLLRLPLTSWPFPRVGFLILLFPVLAYGLFVMLAFALFLVVDLGRESTVSGFYAELAEHGVPSTGTVDGERRESIRGARRRVFDYAFVDPSGRRRVGRLAPLAGDPAAGRHDLRLLADPDLRVGQELVVTFFVDRTDVHAPFVVDAGLLARLDEQARERRRQSAKLAVAIPVLAWLIWNLLIRTGSHFELSHDRPRLVLIARDVDPFADPADRD